MIQQYLFKKIVYLQSNLQGKVKFLSGGDSPRLPFQELIR